eukprot:847550-Pyramimonas_sp.AAC.1
MSNTRSSSLSAAPLGSRTQGAQRRMEPRSRTLDPKMKARASPMAARAPEGGEGGDLLSPRLDLRASDVEPETSESTLGDPRI